MVHRRMMILCPLQRAKTNKITFSPRMKESLLYILKHILAEVGSYGTAISADSARLLLSYIRSSIQDRKF